MSRVKILVSGLGLVLLSLSLRPEPARGFTEQCRYGVNAHQSSNNALDLAAAAGIGWVRFDMNWFQFEPSQGSYGWGEADRFMNHAASLGLHVFVTVAYTPSWAAQPCNDADPNELNWCRNALPTVANAWIDFLTAALGRYQSTVKHWGMWNEPNLSSFFRGTRDEYVNQILIPGANTVHSLCSDCYVLGPELANLRGAAWDSDEGTCVAGNCAFNGWNYSLIQILQAAGSYLDIITHHKYKDPATEWWTQLLDGEFIVIQIMNGAKEVIDQYGQGQPVWITELGWETPPYGSHPPAYAASQLTEVYTGLYQVVAGTYPGPANQPWPELDKLFWYDLVDDPNAASWGLLDSSENPKDPYTAYAAAIQALGDCTGTTPGPDAGVQQDAAGPTPDGQTPGTDSAVNPSDGQSPPGDGQLPGSDGAAPGTDSGADPPGTAAGGCSCRASGSIPASGSVPASGLLWILVMLGLLTRRARVRGRSRSR